MNNLNIYTRLVCCIILWLFKDHFAQQFPIERFGITLSHSWKAKALNPFFFSLLNRAMSLSSVTWAGPGWAAAAVPAVFLFGSAAHGGRRLAIWERQIWKGLCVLLSDKAAFVRTPNHQSEKTLISIFTTLLSSGCYTLLRCPLLASNSGWAHDTGKSVKKVFRLQQI